MEQVFFLAACWLWLCVQAGAADNRACSATDHDCHEHNSIRRQHFSDFVYLVECELATNRLIMESLSTWLDLSNDLLHYDQVGAVVYSSHAVSVTSLSPLHSISASFLLEQCQQICSEEKNDSNSSSVERLLQIVIDVLSGNEITSSSQPRLYLRPHADKHLISFTAHSSVSHQDEKINKLMSLIIHNTSLERTALHFFVNSSSSVIGSPEHVVRYRDCTHVNMALTLSALIRAGHSYANTLQAHLLSKGTMIEVNDISDLGNIECVRNLNPSLWTQFTLDTVLDDKCAIVQQRCNGNMLCSPLHGCVKAAAQTNPNRAAIPNEFFASHADIASYISQQGVTGLTDSLSVTEAPSNPSMKFSLSDIIVGSPDTMLWRPDKPFVQLAKQNGVPLVLKNSVVSTWKAMTDWNISYLQDKIDLDILTNVKCSNSWLTFDPDRRASLHLNLSIPYILRNMTKDEFFSCLQGNCSSDGYRGHYYFGSVPKSLKDDLKPDRLLYNTDKDYSAGKQFIWLSSAGMITHAHFDQDFNFFVQLVGEKRFTLWSPSQHELLSVYPRVHPMWHKSRINMMAPDTNRFPLFSQSRALQVTVKPGDVLFIPPYTWHYVETLSPSVSLSTWSHDYQLYDHMKAIYKHDHKFDLIADPKGN